MNLAVVVVDYCPLRAMTGYNELGLELTRTDHVMYLLNVLSSIPIVGTNWHFINLGTADR